MNMPTEIGQYEFKGLYSPQSEYVEPVDFFDWCPANVFFNEHTKRLNARVKKDIYDYTDYIGNFDGEWRKQINAENEEADSQS
jgi:hypothetical protein